jgi:hypothetical protein
MSNPDDNSLLRVELTVFKPHLCLTALPNLFNADCSRFYVGYKFKCVKVIIVSGEYSTLAGIVYQNIGTVVIIKHLNAILSLLGELNSITVQYNLTSGLGYATVGNTKFLCTIYYFCEIYGNYNQLH